MQYRLCHSKRLAREIPLLLLQATGSCNTASVTPGDWLMQYHFCHSRRLAHTIPLLSLQATGLCNTTSVTPGDWLIQYRFCEPVMPAEGCTDADRRRVVASVEVDTGGYSPTRLDIECRCQSGIYFMQGWMLIEETFWKYDFVCDRVGARRLVEKMCQLNFSFHIEHRLICLQCSG